ncbi:hypothetical protein [uncultured Roseobacter sp.]|uniref:hypothetical protein n=1 Tax=uncultured Roseobacter sp. TaxID=114847 RepID=UPI00263954A4|nr:hypothetical protein [uncultured Roseobacter sp.]
MDLQERVAVLEERTRPTSKSLLDHLKEWGGVGTLIVALLYTFPLGVWDRFYLTSKARAEAEIGELRLVALEIAKLDGDWARTAGGISTPELQTMATRAVGSQKTTLLTGKLDEIVKYQDQLTTPELVMFAYSVSQINMPELADSLYQKAFEKSEMDETIWLSADILRLRATSLLNKSIQFDIDEVRSLYGESAKLLASSKTDAFVLQLAFTLFDWATIEFTKGDWACGEILSHKALEKLDSLPAFNPVVAQYKRQFVMRIGKMSPHIELPRKDCSANLVSLVK